jgi:hypothetical protein
MIAWYGMTTGAVVYPGPAKAVNDEVMNNSDNTAARTVAVAKRPVRTAVS